MKLLDVNTFKLKEYIGERIPPYAILSHTWDEDVILYRDIENGDPLKLKNKRGSKKI